MMEKQAATPTMYCRKCGYQLAGLSEPRCPECGRPFDPADRRTFMRHPKGWLVRRWLRRAAWATVILVPLMAVLLGTTILVLESRSQAQAKAVASVHRVGGRVLILRSTSKLLVSLFGFRTNQGWSDQVGPGTYRPGLLGTRFAHLNDRADMVQLYANTSASNSDHWQDLPVDDALMDDLRGLVYASRIDICSQQLTDAGVDKLRDFPSKVFVSIRSPRVSQTGSDLRWPDRPNVRVLKMSDRRARPMSQSASASQSGAMHVAPR